ncbi:MAG: methyltransferase domain-containing protein [Magnetococcales bacterium]|nr:methyltransferase domain-containing protein [Magnetococcales bacterium]MBF0150365.1 methyltransferase domain-containing protein [Magnetococcales bacterium]
MSWNQRITRGSETRKIKYFVVPFTRGTGVDLGCGDERIWPGTLGIDRMLSPNGAGLARDISDLSIFADQSLDYVFSSHALDDFPASRTLEVLTEWWRVIKPGGHLVLYLPHKDHDPRVKQTEGNPAQRHALDDNDILELMRCIAATSNSGVVVKRNEVRNSGNEYSFLQVYGKTRQTGFTAAASLSGRKRALVIRYGGFGDILQAASVFPGLRQQGYEVWVNTTGRGGEILAHDPHVDGWWLQDPDQVPNAELGDYWQALRQCFELVINLSESVEGTLLTLPHRVNDHWHDQARRLLLNHNHMTVIHALAGVPSGSRLRFHPSVQEQRQAQRMRRALGKGAVILWVLAGSSMHKAWPFVDHVLAALLLERPDLHIILVGDDCCRILEGGWYRERRIIRRSGRWSIRRTLSVALHVDVLVGPETGVMNAMGLEDVGKVLFLSHSSVDNISSHWKNTINLSPPAEVTCHPCHRLHYGWDRCHRDPETSAAWCAAAITPDRVMAAILFLLGEVYEQKRSH